MLIRLLHSKKKRMITFDKVVDIFEHYLLPLCDHDVDKNINYLDEIRMFLCHCLVIMETESEKNVIIEYIHRIEVILDSEKIKKDDKSLE